MLEVLQNEDLNNLLKEKDEEIKRLKKIMKECSDRIMKELNENSHLSYGPALSINYKLTHYTEFKGSV